VQARSPDEFERAFAELTRERAEVLLVQAEPLFVFYRSHIVQLAAKHRLPVVAQHRGFTEAGGLLLYGPIF
jgi:putative ABC transport system substrate-binding protein